jgi:hypothetical protein
MLYFSSRMLCPYDSSTCQIQRNKFWKKANKLHVAVGTGAADVAIGSCDGTMWGANTGGTLGGIGDGAIGAAGIGAIGADTGDFPTGGGGEGAVGGFGKNG